MLEFQKRFSLVPIKQAGEDLEVGEGIKVTDADLAAINRFSRKNLTADQVFIQKFLAAHNMVDREKERFSEELLSDLAKTIPGKSLLKNHNHSDDPLGLVFSSELQKSSIEEVKALVGAEMNEVKGTDNPELLFIKMFIFKTDKNLEERQKIDSGVFQHGSISLGAERGLEKEHNGHEFFEIQARGEAHEFSLVFLGAQQGAGKRYKNKEKTEPEKGNKGMDKVLEIMGAIGEAIGKKVTESTVTKEIKAVIQEGLEKVKELTTKVTELEKEAKELKPQAEEGKKYKSHLVGEFVRLKGVVKEVEATEEAKKELEKFANSFDMDFIKNEIVNLSKRVDETFTADPQLIPSKPIEKKTDDKKKDEDSNFD